MRISCCACDRLFEYDSEVHVKKTISCPLCNAIIEIIQIDQGQDIAMTMQGFVCSSTSSDGSNSYVITSGNVGIGEIDPHYTFSISAPNTNSFQFYTTPSPAFQVHTHDIEFSIANPELERAFYLNIKGQEIIRVDTSGNFFVKGNSVTNDREIYDAFIAFLHGVGALNRPLTTNQNMILHNDPMTGGLSRFDIARKDSTSDE